ncbi:IclR family transcriptional regulator [Falsiroseomonas tokyonensis]|uniref:IclR family transcriptional regulator n=1 Tax=Falsiroseomonas tokyonensis TaxID=430521 RepID=A0ABV7C107_9PROT|nr:IclR family transcriptional regulator [Falsiroseomonas tokyonensis]MBU8540601.1 IclR family transcriptional regulator [Falsiroseomonas tokyonensis]
MAEKGKRRPALEGVASADRALTVLSAFRKGDRSLSLAQLAERTGLVKSTIMRLAISLEEHGFLAREEDSSYRLDAEVLRLGTIYTQSFRMESHVVPVLEELVARTGESAAFYVRRGEQRLCLFRVDSPHLLRLHVRVGDALPLDNSAIAQVLRSFAPRPLPAYVAALDLPIVTMGATDPHTGAMAAPVFGPGDKLAGALALSAPIIRWTAEAQAAARPILIEAGATLTRRIGGTLPDWPRAAAE